MVSPTLTRFKTSWDGLVNWGKLYSWYHMISAQKGIMFQSLENSGVESGKLERRAATRRAGRRDFLIWRFPEMVVPLNHAFIDGFSIIINYKPTSYWGSPIYGNLIFYCMIKVMLPDLARSFECRYGSVKSVTLAQPGPWIIFFFQPGSEWVFFFPSE